MLAVLVWTGGALVWTGGVLVWAGGILVWADEGHGETLVGAYTQGGLVVGQVQAGAQVTLNGKALEVSPAGGFVFGFGRDEGGQVRLRVDGREQVLRVAARTYVLQVIKGVPKRTVEPPKETWARIRQEGVWKRAAKRGGVYGKAFAGCLAWPTQGIITGVYGSRRVYKSEGTTREGRPHGGVDIAAPLGTLVRAPAGGKVVLAKEDLYFEGGTVFLDHGQEVVSAFLHLSAVDVREGQEVRRGATVGKVGAGGRATGAHLDWRLYWRGKELDPQLVGQACLGR